MCKGTDREAERPINLFEQCLLTLSLGTEDNFLFDDISVKTVVKIKSTSL